MALRAPVPPFETEIDLGDRTAPVTARVNRRARRLIVKVDAAGGRVLVTAPSKRALPEALAFARTRAGWIRDRLDELGPARPFEIGARAPFRGAMIEILSGGPSARAAVRLENGAIVCSGDARHANRRIVDWMKREARREIADKVDAYARALGRRRGSISIRDTRSRWGSCAEDGALSFSWRLILAPPPILDYVCAHECAHLVHLDHSPAFWRCVRSLGVDARASRDWFAEHGPALYSYGVVRA
jgi:predicted metal-dependent hydrolase